MCKVDKKWLKENGWKELLIHTSDNSKKHTIYTFGKGTKRFARLDHHFETHPDWRGNLHKSNWYEFYCCGNGFTIENRISYRRMTIEQIESALKIVGLL